MTKHDSFDPLTMLCAAPLAGVRTATCSWADTEAIPADSSAQR